MIRQRLTEAAFWHEKVCLDCGAPVEAAEAECDVCASDNLADAGKVERYILLIEGEGD